MSKSAAATVKTCSILFTLILLSTSLASAAHAVPIPSTAVPASPLLYVLPSSSGNDIIKAGNPGQIPTYAGVNPYKFSDGGNNGPGLADYGVSNGNTPYVYNTTEFEGVANISSLETTGQLGGGNIVSIELNANLQFITENGCSYTYLVQEVGMVQTTSGPQNGSINFCDYVYNESNSLGAIQPGSVSGSGKIPQTTGSTFYVDGVGNLPGNKISLNYPSVVGFRLISTFSDLNGINVPEVQFQYRDGYGWIDSNNITFPFATAVSSDLGFVVNGFTYNPYGTFYDAEFLLGNYIGLSSSAVGGNVSLKLEYYNGYNFQPVSNAYTFGSDSLISRKSGLSFTQGTVTPISGLGEHFAYSNTDLQPEARMSLGKYATSSLYNDSGVSWLNVATPMENGTLYSGNRELANFTGNVLNLTMEPGNYSFSLKSSPSSCIDITSETLQAGNVTTYTEGVFKVEFNEYDPLDGAYWYVDFGGVSHMTGSRTLSFYALSGVNYPYSVGASPHFRPVSSGGSLSETSQGGPINVGIIPDEYSLDIIEHGLPKGDHYQISVSSSYSGLTTNNTAPGTDQSSGFTLQYACYTILLNSGSGYVPFPGTIHEWLGTNSTVNVSFMLPPASPYGLVDNTFSLATGEVSHGEVLDVPQLPYSSIPVSIASGGDSVYVGNPLGSIFKLNAFTSGLETSTAGGQEPRAVAYNSASDALAYANLKGNIEVRFPGSSTNPGIGFYNYGMPSSLALDPVASELLAVISNRINVLGLTAQSVFTSGATLPGTPTMPVFDQYSNSMISAYTGQNGSINLAGFNATHPGNQFQFATALSGRINYVYAGAGNSLYLFGNGFIDVLNSASYRVEKVFNLDVNAVAGAYDPQDGVLYALTNNTITGQPDHALISISMASGQIIHSIPLPSGTNTFSYDSRSETIFMGNGAAGTVYEVSPEYYGQVSFYSRNLPHGTQWDVFSANGQKYYSNGTGLSLYVPNGNYSFSARSSNSSWNTGGSVYHVTMDNNSATVVINWREVLYNLTVVEDGLPPGTDWNMSFEGAIFHSIAGKVLQFQLPNGSYTYLVKNVTGFELNSNCVNFSVNGSGEILTIHFHRPAGITGFFTLAHIIAIVAAAVIAVSLAYGLWRRGTGKGGR